MPRLRGTTQTKPEGESAWAMLNQTLFGDNGRGGYNVTTVPEALPFDWSATFGREARLGLEIGFNRGVFLRGLSKRFPERNFVGIEVRRRYVWRLTHLLGDDVEAPRNLRLIWADAKRVTTDLFAAGSVNDVFITFPDPWWKKRHAKRRLVSTDYASDLARLLPVGGVIWVKTDVPAIAEEIRESLASVAALGAPEAFGADELPLTHREGSCIKAGLPIYRFRVEKLRA